jgi:tRNA-specific 2-thiouridylase
MPARVVLAMSGGVDSSVAAYLLKQQGYDVIGLFMRTGVHSEDDSPSRKKGCCSARDASDARRVADMLDLPFYALDFEQDFAQIMDYFVDEYLTGRTPNPCVVCNNWLKFGKLWSYGKQLDADFVATGHYARVVEGPAGPELHRATDSTKDQSYVLAGLDRKLLSHLLFPIGTYTKNAVRNLALEAGLGVHDKPDSVEICFVPGSDHAAFIRKRRPGLATAGSFVDRSGNVLGEHGGYERYTIGQRKGLGFGSSCRRYVLEVIPESRQVVLGNPEQLLATGLIASRVNWLVDKPLQPMPCEVRIRYRHKPAPAAITPQANDMVRVNFTETQSAVTPGQAVVFYKEEQVLGGGWIEEQFSK